ncbi:MAG: hypothetical protein E7597_07115 [Ruminococcaceae bacterium]|nr:hypothetical protein [Oscillospiraceae bacterium]
MGVINNGVLEVFVPDGWQHFAGTDSDGKETPYKLFVYKNANGPLDIFYKCGITLCFTPSDKLYMSPKCFYDNVKDIEPITVGKYQWTGYTCTSLGYPYIMLESNTAPGILQAMLLLENGDNKIAFDDKDVKAILESINIIK